MSFSWTPETLHEARRLYLEEGFSATETAKRIGTTRSALITKAHRMGWAEERDPRLASANMLRKALGAGNRREGRPPPVLTMTEQPIMGAVEGSRPRTLLALEDGQCRWPLGGAGLDTLFCGADVGQGGGALLSAAPQVRIDPPFAPSAGSHQTPDPLGRGPGAGRAVTGREGRRVTRPPVANTNDPAVLSSVAVMLADATATELGQVVALSAGLLTDRSGPAHTRKVLHNVASAVVMPEATPAEAIRLRIREIALAHGVTYEELIGDGRGAGLVRVRHKAVWMLRRETGLTYVRLGRYFRREHSSLSHAVARHEARVRAGEDTDAPIVRPAALLRMSEPGAPPWSSGEILIIRRFYVWHSDKEIANALTDGGFSRSVDAVKNCRLRLGLYRTERGLRRYLERTERQAAE